MSRDPATPWLRVLSDVLPGHPMTFTDASGSFALWESRSFLVGRHLTALPLSSVGRPSETLIDAARLYADHERIPLILRDSDGPPPRHGVWRPHARRTHVIVEGADRMRLSASRRRNLREAETNGLRCYWRPADHWTPFYALYQQRMHEIGSPAYSRRLCSAIAKHAPHEYQYAYVTLPDDRVIAAALVRHGSAGCHVILQADAAMYRALYSPTVLLYWTLMEQSSVDFGRSVPGSSVERFKLRFGGIAAPVTDWCYTPPGIVAPSLDRTQHPILTRVWPRVPSVVANLIGPWVAAQAT